MSEENKINGVGNFLASNFELIEHEYEENHLSTQVIQKSDNTSVMIYKGEKYQLLPIDQLDTPFPVKLNKKEIQMDKDKVYKVVPGTYNLIYENKIPVPDDLLQLPAEQQSLILANHFASLTPKGEKILTTETMPKPLLSTLMFRLGMAVWFIILAIVAHTTGFATWHIYIIMGLCSFINLYNAAITYYYIKTRNFKMFSGIITNIHVQNGWSPSFRKTYVQISNGKKFLTFPFGKSKLNKNGSLQIGSPVTIFIPNIAPIKETFYGPTVEFLLAVSFSLDIKSSDSKGEFKDGRMNNQSTYKFFKDE